MDSCSFNYTLTKAEAYEAFLQLSMRDGRSTSGWQFYGLVISATVSLLLQWKYPGGLHFIFLGSGSIVMLFYLVYGPIIRARIGAFRVAGIPGKYNMTLSSRGCVLLQDGTEFPLNQEQESCFIETETVFVIRPCREQTFCLPKRILSEDEVAAVQHILTAYLGSQQLAEP